MPEYRNVLGGTGHRDCPDLTLKIERRLVTFKPDLVITGMADGFDTMLAEVADSLNIPLLLAQPFEAGTYETAFWTRLKTKHHHVMTARGGFTNTKFKLRNHFIVRKSHVLLAYLRDQNSGTAHAVNIAKAMNKPIIYL